MSSLGFLLFDVHLDIGLHRDGYLLFNDHFRQELGVYCQLLRHPVLNGYEYCSLRANDYQESFFQHRLATLGVFDYKALLSESLLLVW